MMKLEHHISFQTTHTPDRSPRIAKRCAALSERPGRQRITREEPEKKSLPRRMDLRAGFRSAPSAIPAIAAGFLLMAAAWNSAHAMTIDEAVEAALANNPGLQAAMHRVEAARAATTQTRSTYYPTVFLGGAYTRTDNPTHAFMMALNQRSLDMNDPELNFNEPDDIDNMRLTAGVRYQLYDGGQRRAVHRIKRLGVDAEQYATASFQNTLAYLVQEGYYQALQARAFVTVRKETVTSLEESLRVARERFDAGSAVVTDVLNLEVQVAQAREDWVRAKHEFELALAALNTTIGADKVRAETLTHPGPAIEGVPEEGTPSPVAAAHDRKTHGEETGSGARISYQLIADHPELRAAAVMLGIREQGIRRARGAYAPTLNAFGTADWDSDVSSDYERSYMIGIAAEWELFDGFRRRGALRESRAQRAEAEATYERVRDELMLDVKQAHIRVQDARERMTVARASEDHAARALDITRAQYEQGAATLADLLTAQSGLTATRTRQTAAHYDYLTALANRERAEGNLIRPGQRVRSEQND